MEAKQYTPLPPSVPQLRLPQNGAYEGSTVAGLLRVRFAWEPSTVPKGTVTYELQYSSDSGFGTDVVTVQTESVSHQTEGALQVSALPPVGRRYYWRVRACLQICSDHSPTWKVNLGRSSKDFNGDGYADIVIGTPSSDEQGSDAGRAYVYFGGSGNIDVVPDGVLSNGSSGSNFGYSVSSAGDFNDDGFADVIVGAPFANPGRAFVYFGGPGAAFDATADVVLSEGAAGDAFGLSVSDAGDLNGDGFSDVAVGAPRKDVGRAYLYAGGRGGQLDIADGILTGGVVNGQFAKSFASIGDLNADGFADVVINELDLNNEVFIPKCSSHVYLGAPGKDLSSLEEHVIVGDAVVSCLIQLIGAHDLNHDGFSDLLAVVVTAGKRRLMLFMGGAVIDGTPYAVVLMENLAVYSVSTAGDVNGDLLEDVLMNEQYLGVLPQSSIYLGATNDVGYTIATRPTSILNTGVGPSAGAGDVNGDGLPDVIAAGGGVARVYLGGAVNFDTVADAVFDHAASGGNVSVASSGSVSTAR